uniref:LRA-7 n=1 Tax=uncultured bacterium BLR7 TaxID=506523 RepID=B5L5W3_9BACT|nr:LRA7 family subclass B3 metallo-beta-lactamase [uncultured bacterium BLR7]ACH58998.1 LRA-7 [uncultured bacterium BLR7]
MRSKFLLATALVLSTAFTADAADAPKRLPVNITNQDWLKPFPGFKIVGNMYYVGTYDLGCYLIDTGAGLILVNTGIMGSYPLMKASIESLGFKTSDIKIITATHGHSDHVADMASFKKDAPSAVVYMSERDVESLESGGNFDYRRPAPEGRGGLVYDPIHVDVKTKPGDHIKLGNVDMTVLQAYGHTPGATSFQFQQTDAGKTYNVMIVNMNGINAGVKLLGSPKYPTIVEDFKNTIDMQATYKPDIWVSSHAGQFNLHQVYKPGDAYNPARFGDQAAYQQKIATAKANYEKQLAEERAAAK